MEGVGVRQCAEWLFCLGQLPQLFNCPPGFQSYLFCSLQPDPSLQNVDQIRPHSFNLFSFQPPDDPFETIRSWHASAQNPPTTASLLPHLTPSKMQSPANGPPLLPSPLLAQVFLKYTLTLSPLHWPPPQPPAPYTAFSLMSPKPLLRCRPFHEHFPDLHI